jgi:hypothetical protein
MEYREFLTNLMTFKKLTEDLSELHDIGFDFFEGKYRLATHIESMMVNTFNSHYTKEGVEWIEWFIYEADYGMKDFSSSPSYEKNEDGEVRWGARDEDGTPICYSYESLYEYIQQYKK